MNSLFKSVPIGLDSWGMIIALAFTTFIVVETEKWIRRRRF
jgi:hypothetical protein